MAPPVMSIFEDGLYLLTRKPNPNRMTNPPSVQNTLYPGMTLKPNGIIILKSSSPNDRVLLKNAVMDKLPASAIDGARKA